MLKFIIFERGISCAAPLVLSAHAPQDQAMAAKPMLEAKAEDAPQAQAEAAHPKFAVADAPTEADPKVPSAPESNTEGARAAGSENAEAVPPLEALHVVSSCGPEAIPSEKALMLLQRQFVGQITVVVWGAGPGTERIPVAEPRVTVLYLKASAAALPVVFNTIVRSATATWILKVRLRAGLRDLLHTRRVWRWVDGMRQTVGFMGSTSGSLPDWRVQQTAAGGVTVHVRDTGVAHGSKHTWAGTRVGFSGRSPPHCSGNAKAYCGIPPARHPSCTDHPWGCHQAHPCDGGALVTVPCCTHG